MSSPSVQRLNAVETLSQAARWSVDSPALLVAFLATVLLDSFGQLSTGAFSLLSLLAGLFVGGLAYVYADAKLRGEPTSLGEAAGPVASRYLSLIGIFVVYAVLVGIGLVLLVLPGVYLGARLILAFPACVLDDENAFEALATGWEVAGGNVLKLVGIFLLLFAVSFGFALVGLTALGLEFAENPLFLFGFAPVSAFLTATVELATARVYLENREGGSSWASPSGGRPRRR